MPLKEEPDSARSWAVAFAGFVINFCLSGLHRSTALIYVEMIHNYGISRMNANLPFTIRCIIRSLTGSLVGVIGQRYGSCEVTMVGGLFACLGVALCTFVSDITWICLLWGGIHGLGVALGQTLFQVTIDQYFKKHRATASGFSWSGACAGAFILPFLIEYLLTNLGLHGTFLLTGGLMLHVVPAGMLMKEPPWIQKKSRAVCSENADCRKTNKLEDDKSKTEEIFAISCRRVPSTHEIILTKNQMEVKDKEIIKRGICNHGFQDTFYAKTPIEKLKTDDEATTSPEQNFSIYQNVKHMIRDPMFHLISLSYATFIVLFDVCVTIIVDYVKDKGISQSHGKYFLTTVSVADVIGRLGFGWVTDRKYLSLPKYMMLLLIIQSALGLMPFIHSFNSLMVLVAVFSVATGANKVMYPILIATYMPTRRSLAIGSSGVAGGLISFAVPPMIGYFRDTTGSYDNLYFVLGAFSAITGFLWCLEPLFLKWKTSNKQQGM